MLRVRGELLRGDVSVNLYNASGNQTSAFAPDTGDGNPPNGQSQRRVLFATASAQTDFGMPAGYTLAAEPHRRRGRRGLLRVRDARVHRLRVVGKLHNTSGTPLP